MNQKAFFLLSMFLVAPMLALAQTTVPAGYALNFNGSNNYVSATLASPPASNYTISAWVYLRTGGTATGTRMAVLSATVCNSSIELLIHSSNSSASSPQLLELGRCSGFNGFLSTNAVPLDTWTYVAATLTSNKTVGYYINGQPAGVFADGTGSHNYAFGTAVNLGDNSGRMFDGLLDEVQIWNRALTSSQIQNNWNHSLVGNETGLYAYYRFDEGTGNTTADSAVAAGGSVGTLINNPAWLGFSNVVSTPVDGGPGSLRTALTGLAPGGTITFATNLSGQTITLANGTLTLSNNLSIDASALPGGVALSGGGLNQIFNVASGANVSLQCLTLTQGVASDAGGAIYTAPGSVLNIARCTLSGNNALEGGALLNDGVLQIQNSTFTGNNGDFGGALQCRAPATLTHCTVSANTGQNAAGIYNKDTTLTLNNCIVGANTASSQPQDLYSENAALVLVNANIIDGFSSTTPTNVSGPAALHAAPLLSPLGHFGGPTQTMPPLSDSPALDIGGSTSLTIDQRGFPRVIGPAPDLGAVELDYSDTAVSTTADGGLGSLRYILSYAPPGAMITFATYLSGGTIALTSGQIILNNSLTLDASALPAGITISGNNSSRLFYIGTNASVVLTGLTLAHGFVSGANAMLGSGLPGGDAVGGGIYNAGTLTLNYSTLAYNTVMGGSGAVNDPFGNAEFNFEMYPGNGFGGGIYNAGNLNLIESTVASNSAVGGTGGSDNQDEAAYGGGGSGGGIYQAGQYTIQVTQSTISGNLALTGASGIADFVFGFNDTVGTDGGGVCSDGSQNANLELYNSILAGNVNGDSYWPAGFAVNPGNIVGGDSGLAPLGYYGGPTPTMPPSGESPAIDAGNDSATNLFATDQRGQPRLSGRHVDSGAVEVAVGMPAISNLLAWVTGTNTASGTFTVELAATVTPNSEISMPASFQYGVSQAYGLGSGPISLPGNYTSLSPPMNVTYTTISMSPGKTVHWIIVASNGAYTNMSTDQTLTLPLNGLAGDLNGDGIVSQSELNTVYSNYLSTSPWLLITNAAGLGGTNVTFMLSNSIAGAYSVQYSTNLVNWFYLGPATPRYLFTDTNASAQPKRYYRLSYP